MNAGSRDCHLTAIHDHYCEIFGGHDHAESQWKLGPVPALAPWFRVLRFAPGPRTALWTYLSIGASLLRDPADSRLEFLLSIDRKDERGTELVTMVAYYHRNQGLGVGHTLPIGEPWMEGSSCDHLLISKPYLLGSELEICNLADMHLHVLWLLPITKRECDFKVEAGLEVLEQRFEQAQLQYWDVLRGSVV